ncbi:uncharacterized protein (TIGR02246 family) [Litorimonas taeanensis]|uniref:Uncharacterized protein (TIGR02246 family) n=1 Tax=Litorimonas taeanensis TaxID=568099 RepID=A0A420WMH9_9PROT|nr:SgcJ/EcaC family oxidoreductase [Litorimonas taeanensis]RKQ72189.1 uncharacterized protein (TIGR02246 family) [Litorimonas taeanensis]
MDFRKIFIAAALSCTALTACSQADQATHQPSVTAETHQNMETDMQADPKIAVVEEMITAWNEKEWNKIADLFTEDGVLHSMMIDPVVGRETIRKRIVGLGEGLSEITLNIINIGRINDVVVIERVDEFTYKGHKGKVPVVGILEVEGDKVKVWREYYDRAELLAEMGLEHDFD